MGHARVAIRSDNEPAIVSLVSSAANMLKINGIDVTCEGSTVYDPQSIWLGRIGC